MSLISLYTHKKDVSFNQNAKRSVDSKLVAGLPAKNVSSTDFLNTRNYVVAFLGKKNYTDNEREFINFRKAFSTKLHKAKTSFRDASWNFNTNSNDETSNIFKNKTDEFTKIFQDKQILSQLKQFQQKGISDPDLKRHLAFLIDEFEENITCKPELDILLNEQIEVRKKVNKNPWYKEYPQDLVKLVKLRNEFAQKRGYRDFFSYMIEEAFEVDETQLFNLMKELETKTDKIYEESLKNRNSLLCLRTCKYIENKQQLLPLSRALYNRMGLDLEQSSIKYDLFPRENKTNILAACYEIDPPNAINILGNLQADIDVGLEMLDHEHAHAAYALGISSEIPYLDRDIASYGLSEAIAMLMQKLPYREENFLKEELHMPEKLVKELVQERKEEIISYIRYHLKLINFEKEMYKNPDQGLDELWQDLTKKYEKTDAYENWTSITHFLSSPGYRHNYLRATVMASQIYEALTKKLGPLTENKNTMEYLRQNIFKYGKTLTEDEILTRLTGSTLKADAFINEMKDLYKT